MTAAFEAAFLTRPRDAWAEVFAGTDACVSPVLGLAEAADHAHTRERGVFSTVAGVRHPMPAPRFADSVGDVAPASGARAMAEVLAAWTVARL
jgi:alpha-methylacyl-CoA racemase